MYDIRLIATDLDGTLLGESTSVETFSAFREQLAAIRDRRSIAWVISTGRSMHSFKKVFSPLQMMGIQPDYVILRHAFIFGVTRWGFIPHRLWNLSIRYRVWRDRLNVHKQITGWQGMLALAHKGVKTIEKKPNRLCLQFQNEADAESAAALLEEKTAVFHHLQVFRYLREVDVRAVPHTKGLAVAELARHLGLDSTQVLAIGDGHNDISMMDPKIAELCGCPSNAAPEVMNLVSIRRGHIATAPALSGAIEVIEAFETNRVQSTLPATWQDPAMQSNPLPPKPHRKRNHSHERRPWARIILWILIACTVLTVFASFGMIPFSERIMQPYRIIEGLVTRLLEYFMEP